jgi:hypothetical protein
MGKSEMIDMSTTTISENYRRQQAKLHAQGNYGLAALEYGKCISLLARAVRAKSLLDYGCGSKRSLLKVLELPTDTTYTSFDPAVPEYSARPLAADLVVCIDVLEHIEEPYLENVMDDLASLTRSHVFLSVHTGPAGKFLDDGRNAHLIQQPWPWWREWLNFRFKQVHLQDVPNGFAFIGVPLKR